MPRLATLRAKKKPKGFELVEDTLEEIERQMRDAESVSSDGKRKQETSWAIFRLHHQRSRYVYEMYYKRKLISRELYDWLLREGFGDEHLIAKWKKQGYERLCCVRCIQTRDTNFGSVCICRVPKAQREAGAAHVQCKNCGCEGCATGD